jgi:hypothetical protein
MEYGDQNSEQPEGSEHSAEVSEHGDVKDANGEEVSVADDTANENTNGEHSAEGNEQ